MDLQIRHLERQSLQDPTQNAALLNSYIKSQTGRALFWLGDQPCEDAVACRMSYNVEGLKHEYLDQPVWLVPITDFEDIERGINYHANGILNISKGKQFWFHHRKYIPRPAKASLLTGVLSDRLREGLFEIKTIETATYGGGSIDFWQDCDPKYASQGCYPSSLKNAGRCVSFPYPDYLLFHGISILPMPDCDLTAYKTLVTSTRFQLIIGQSECVNIPTVSVSSPAIGNAGLTATINSPIQPILVLPEELSILPVQTFRASLQPVNGFILKTSVRILLYFHGSFRREV